VWHPFTNLSEKHFQASYIIFWNIQFVSINLLRNLLLLLVCDIKCRIFCKYFCSTLCLKLIIPIIFQHVYEIRIFYFLCFFSYRRLDYSQWRKYPKDFCGIRVHATFQNWVFFGTNTLYFMYLTNIRTYLHVEFPKILADAQTCYVLYRGPYNTKQVLIFQVPTSASMKMTVFWDVAPCSIIEIYQHFRGAYCLHCQYNSPLKRWSISTILHGTTSRKTTIFKC
jgi:hypothetical protein